MDPTFGRPCIRLLRALPAPCRAQKYGGDTRYARTAHHNAYALSLHVCAAYRLAPDARVLVFRTLCITGCPPYPPLSPPSVLMFQRSAVVSLSLAAADLSLRVTPLRFSLCAGYDRSTTPTASASGGSAGGEGGGGAIGGGADSAVSVWCLVGSGDRAARPRAAAHSVCSDRMHAAAARHSIRVPCVRRMPSRCAHVSCGRCAP